jgi:Mrp family chromosome partitioning ATPase
MEKITSEADIVILDAPPLLPVTDAAVIARHTTGAIVAVKAGSTKRTQLRDTLGILAGVDARVSGVVLTMVPIRGRDGYGYGYGYSDEPTGGSGSSRER